MVPSRRHAFAFLFHQPGGGADFSPALQSFVAAAYLQWLGVAGEHLAWEVEAEATVLQAAKRDTTPVDGTLTPARLSKLIATAAA